MQQHEWEKVKEIFTAALEKPARLRTQFVVESCGADEQLRREVESLLEAHEEPNLLEKHSFNLAEQIESAAATYAGKRFGPYRVLREIGHGGMGAVFLAERADGAFQQQVALKIIRQSVADQVIEQHFLRERQILASLNHPNIARLIDGGVSSTGELFLAMEFIEGESLIDFSQNHRLLLEERLRLFLKICRVVSFAHQNLIIHRDLKPSNILVAVDGEPKLLDFGLAKVFDAGRGIDSAETVSAFRAFTPAYAAPEQILGKPVSITSDVFSLGVILYELLTNEKPFHFEGKSLEDVIKAITSAEPALPSRIVDLASAHSATRQRQLKGDLDNITIKALQKDPARRYQSVSQFADDIERHLDHQPISARPNTFSYRTLRFYQRNKIAVSAATLIVFALILGLAIALWQYRTAKREGAKAEVVNAFLKKMLLTGRPGGGATGKKGYQATITDILLEAERRLDSEELRSQPEIRAELQTIVGACYGEQGNYVAAERILQQALDNQHGLYGTDSVQSLPTELALASISFAKADYDNAESIYRPRIPLLLDELQKHSIEAELVADSLINYALLRRARGDSINAETFLRQSLTISSQHGLESHIDQARLLLTLILIDQGKFDEAESNQRAELLRYQDSGKETPEFCSALTLFGIILMEQGDLGGAESNLRQAEQLYRKLYSPNFIALHDNLRLQAQVAYLAGRYLEADTFINRVLENYRRNSNPQYINFATALTIQGAIVNKLGRSEEAEKILRQALQLREENLPEKHFMTALTRGTLGECLITQGRFEEAESLLKSSYDDLKLSQAKENPRLTAAVQRLATLYDAWKKPDQATQYRALLKNAQ